MSAGHEPVPPEIAKTLVGWKKYFNAYTTNGRFNVVMTSFAMTGLIIAYSLSGGKKPEKK